MQDCDTHGKSVLPLINVHADVSNKSLNSGQSLHLHSCMRAVKSLGQTHLSDDFNTTFSLENALPGVCVGGGGGVGWGWGTLNYFCYVKSALASAFCQTVIYSNKYFKF